MTPPDLTYLSLGGGVQSSVLALMLSRGLLAGVRPPDVALFADTGWEPAAVYAHLDQLEPHLSFPLHRLQGAQSLRQAAYAGNIASDLPVHILTEDGTKTMRNRRCTTHFKIYVIHRWVRRHLGVKTLRGKRCDAYIGISLDEGSRMKPSRSKWEMKHYPLVDALMRRRDCLQWWEEHGLGYPLVRSACVTCPFHTHAEWLRLLDDPETAAEIIAYDEHIRDGTNINLEPGWRAYLHGSCRPVREIVEARRRVRQEELFDDDDATFSTWNNECEGVCGV